MMLRRLLSRWLSQRSAAHARGVTGERLAEAHLEGEKGMRMVARNWRSPRDARDEIDLVMKDGEVLVFVEVKTRTAGALVPGYHAVDQRKKAVLRRAIRDYLRRLTATPLTHRLDIVEVALPADGEAGQPEVRHFANVALTGRKR